MDIISINAAEIVTSLKQSGMRICCAESCTGGMIAAAITDIAGSSAVFSRGFVTYSNQAKIKDPIDQLSFSGNYRFLMNLFLQNLVQKTWKLYIKILPPF